MSSVTDQANSTASMLEQAAEAAMGGNPGYAPPSGHRRARLTYSLWIGPYIIA